MKKKFLSALTCLALILVCLFVATGCNEGDPNIYVSTAQELTTAVANAKDDTTIVLKNDIDLPTAVEVSKEVVVNLNGKKLTVTADTAGDGVFHVIAGGDLTINGDGEVNGVGNNKWNIAVFADGGNVTINGGVYTNVGATGEDPTHYDVIYAKNGSKIVINGGTFKGQTPNWLLNIYDDHTATTSIEVKGGTFEGFNPADCLSEGENTNFVADGYQSVAQGGNYVVSKIAE